MQHPVDARRERREARCYAGAFSTQPHGRRAREPGASSAVAKRAESAARLPAAAGPRARRASAAPARRPACPRARGRAPSSASTNATEQRRATALEAVQQRQRRDGERRPWTRWMPSEIRRSGRRCSGRPGEKAGGQDGERSGAEAPRDEAEQREVACEEGGQEHAVGRDVLAEGEGAPVVEEQAERPEAPGLDAVRVPVAVQRGRDLGAEKRRIRWRSSKNIGQPRLGQARARLNRNSAANRARVSRRGGRSGGSSRARKAAPRATRGVADDADYRRPRRGRARAGRVLGLRAVTAATRAHCHPPPPS